MKVCELIFDSRDIIDYKKISELENLYRYLVAKIPGDSAAMVHAMEEIGFRYLENQQTIYFETDQFLKIDECLKDRFREINCVKIHEKDSLENICELIKEGLYVKGRITADPLIPEGVSDLRIINWLKDLYMDEDALIYSLEKNSGPVGYFVLKRTNKVHLNIVQAGVFREYQNRGYSFLLLYYILKTAFKNEFTGIFASVSANNIKTMNSISKFVYVSIKESYVVLRKMINNKG